MAEYICPVCRAPKKLRMSARLTITTHVRVALITLAVAAATYFVFGPESGLKSLALYLPLWAICEFVQGVRLRESARCNACGFDPHLYRTDRKAARTQVEARLNESMGRMTDELRKRAERERNLHVRQSAPTFVAPSVPTPILVVEKSKSAGSSTAPTSRVVKVGDRNL